MSIVFTKILYKAKKLCYTTSSFLFYNIKVIIKCKYNKKKYEIRIFNLKSIDPS